MRKGKDNSVIVNENGGQFIGINLGADYCTEHECGIDGIKKAFGMPEVGKRPFQHQPKLIGQPIPPFGLERRRITMVPDTLTLTEHTIQPIKDKKLPPSDKEPEQMKVWYLEFRRYPRHRDSPIEINRELLPIHEFQEISTAWSGEDFGIVFSCDAEELGNFQELWDAFQRKDIIIGVFGGGPFQNGGLTIAIASRVPEDVAKAMYDADEDHYNLLIAAEKTGIQARLEEAGKQYFALSPKWAKDIEGSETTYDVVFWLNPEEQRQYNACWCTVEDLDAWIKNEGRIIKSAKAQ